MSRAVEHDGCVRMEGHTSRLLPRQQQVDKGLGEALWTLGNDSARDPKRTKRADVLDEVEPRLCWGRSMTRGELEDTTWAGFLNP